MTAGELCLAVSGNGKCYTELAPKLLMAFLSSQRNKCTVPRECARDIDGGVHTVMGCSGERSAGAQNPEWSGQGKFLVWAVKAEGVTCGEAGNWETGVYSRDLFAWSKECEGESVGEEAEEISPCPGGGGLCTLE